MSDPMIMSRAIQNRELKHCLLDIIEIAKRVGDYLFKSSEKKKKVRFKGEIDIVTQFDKESQDMIVTELTERYKLECRCSAEVDNRSPGWYNEFCSRITDLDDFYCPGGSRRYFARCCL